VHQSIWVSSSSTYPSNPSSYTICSDSFVSNKVSVYCSIIFIGCLYFTISLIGERYGVRIICKLVLSEIRWSYGYLTFYVLYFGNTLWRIFSKCAHLSVKESSVETFIRIRWSGEFESDIWFIWPCCWVECFNPSFSRFRKVYINGSCWGICTVSHINEVPGAIKIVVWRERFRNNLCYFPWGLCKLHWSRSICQGET